MCMYVYVLRTTPNAIECGSHCLGSIIFLEFYGFLLFYKVFSKLGLSKILIRWHYVLAIGFYKGSTGFS